MSNARVPSHLPPPLITVATFLCTSRNIVYRINVLFFFAGDMSSRKTQPEIRVNCLQFSPTGTNLDH